jgi:hypothetical protein
VPHAIALVPSSHELPFQQPVQHAPARQAPPVHVLVSSFTVAHAPSGSHVESVHGLSSAHDLHIAPATPHAIGLVSW